MEARGNGRVMVRWPGPPVQQFSGCWGAYGERGFRFSPSTPSMYFDFTTLNWGQDYVSLCYHDKGVAPAGKEGMSLLFSGFWWAL